jgi:hypothetical protein
MPLGDAVDRRLADPKLLADERNRHGRLDVQAGDLELLLVSEAAAGREGPLGFFSPQPRNAGHSRLRCWRGLRRRRKYLSGVHKVLL